MQHLSIDSNIHWSKLDIDKFPALKTITAGTIPGAIADGDEYAADLAAAPNEHLLDLAKRDIRFTEWSLDIGRMAPGDVEPKFELQGGMQLFYKVEFKSENDKIMVSVHDTRHLDHEASADIILELPRGHHGSSPHPRVRRCETGVSERCELSEKDGPESSGLATSR